MNPYNCNWNTPTKWKPDLRMIVNNPIEDSGIQWKYDYSNKNTYTGTILRMDAENINDCQIIQIKKDKKNCKTGGAGFFGEVKGSCGWKKRGYADCCFSKCSPAWKTTLYPFDIKL
jgi:hypothetical protein